MKLASLRRYKGVTFLNTLNITPQQIEYVVDLNPRKHQQYIAGAGQEIIGPESLISLQPRDVIVMNPVYRQEIQKTLFEMGVQAEILLA